MRDSQRNRRKQSWNNVLRAFIGGWNDAVRMPVILILLWLCNILSSALALSFLWDILTDYLNHSGLHESAFTTLRPDDVLEFMLTRREQLLFAVFPGVIAGTLYVLFKIYITGGVLDRLNGGTGRSWRHFLAACQHYFWKIILLTLLTCGLLAISLAIPRYAFVRLVDWLISSTNGPVPLFLTNMLYGALLFFIISLVWRVYDYARIALLCIPQHKIFRVFWNGLRFPFRHGVLSFSLWFSFLLLSVVLAAMYAWLTARFVPQNMQTVWWYFAFGQFIVFGRIVCRVASLGAQMRFMGTQTT